ncbi:hypothetical protein D3C84_1236670 [compost metagenome]
MVRVASSRVSQMAARSVRSRGKLMGWPNAQFSLCSELYSEARRPARIRTSPPVQEAGTIAAPRLHPGLERQSLREGDSSSIL